MPIQDLIVNGIESTQLGKDVDFQPLPLMNEFDNNNDLPRHRGWESLLG